MKQLFNRHGGNVQTVARPFWHGRLLMAVCAVTWCTTCIVVSGGPGDESEPAAVATVVLERMVHEQPHRAEPYLHLAHRSLDDRQWKRAIIFLRTACVLGCNQPDHARLLADLYERTGHPDTAAAWFRKAIEWGATGHDIHLALAQALRNAAMPREAEYAALTALAKADTPAARADVRLVLGAIAMDDGHGEKAAGHWQQALQDNDELPQVHLYLGVAAHGREDHARAVRHLQAAHRLGRRSQDMLPLLALSYAAEGRKEDAHAILHEYIVAYGFDQNARTLAALLADGSLVDREHADTISCAKG